MELNGAKILYTIHTNIPVLGDFKITQTLVSTWIVMALLSALAFWLGRDLKLENVSKRQAAAEFNLVASRSAQAAVIKAIKEGKTNVDLNAPTTPDNTPGGSIPGGSNTGQTGSDGQGSESTGGTTGKDDTGDGLE